MRVHRKFLRGGFPSRRIACSAAADVVAASEAAASDLLPSQLVWPSRSHNCGRLRESDAGTKVALCGWVDRNRNMGGVQFLDIRDHTGIMQVVRDEEPRRNLP